MLSKVRGTLHPSRSVSVVVFGVLVLVARFDVVVTFAQRLPVLLIPKEFRITTVRTDVVNDRRPDILAFALAVHAQRVRTEV